MWDPKVKTIAALDKGLSVLDAVRETGGASLHELHVRTGLPKATLLRILVTLERRRFIWRRIADGFFCPGNIQDTTKQTSSSIAFLAQCAGPPLARLQARILWPSDLAVRRGNMLMLCETNRAQSYFTIKRDKIGFQVNMLRSAAGRAYLAFCPDAERERILAALRRSGREGDSLARDPGALNAVFAEVRKKGYAEREATFGTDYDKPRTEVDDRLDAIAVPIRSNNRIYGCITIVWIRGVATVAQIATQHLDALLGTAEEISASMARADA